MPHSLTERAPPTSFHTVPTATGSHSTNTTDTVTETETTDSDTITDITDPPIPPTPPVTTTNTTTSTTTSETTSDTSTSTLTSTSISTSTSTSTSISTSTTTTTTTTQNNTDPTSDPPSNTSPPPITSPPLAFTPTAANLPALNTTSATSVTANFTTIVTSLNGQATTITSQLPTSLINLNPSHHSDPHRTTIIAGTTTALFFVLSFLAAIFVYRRHKLRKSLALSEKRKEGRGLLDGEDFDDEDAHMPPTMRSHTSHGHSLGGSVPPALSLLKSRVSGTGSIFREEIWPPPGFVDPISKRSSQVDLSKIVDDVMGPTQDTHEREVTATTTASGSSEMSPFLDDGHHHQASSSSLPDNDPFSSSGQSSFYSASNLPPGASPPVQPGLVASPMIPASRSTSGKQPIDVNDGDWVNKEAAADSTSTHTSPLLLPPAHPLSSSTQPKKSSPLVRALSEGDGVLPAPPEPSVGPSH